MSDPIYVKNLELLKKQLPGLFEKGEILDKKKPKKNLENSFLHFPENLQGIDAVLIWHVGIDTQCIDWLKKHSSTQVIFVENDPERLQNFLAHPKASFLLQHSRVQFFFNDFEQLGYELIFSSYTHAFWQSTSQQEKIEFEKKCEQSQRAAEAFFSWVQDFGEKSFENFFHNILQKKKIFSIQRMEKKASILPAIICGAGPSLKEACPTLHKCQDHALILAAGTAMNFLQKYGINFHFGATIEKKALTERFHEILPHQKLFSIPLASHENLLLWEGDLFWASQLEAYPLQRFLEEKLFSNGISSPIDAGYCVTSFLVSIAHFLGCNPIILVGVDLCYKDDQKYPETIEEEFKEKIWDENFQKMTQKDWLLTKEWLEEFASHHPEIDWINASLGLPLEKPYETLSFENFEKKFFCQLDVGGYQHFLSQKAEQLAYKEDLDTFFTNFEKEIIESLQMIEELFSKECTKNPEVIEAFFLKKPLALYLLHPLWVVWRPVLKKEMEKLDPLSWKESENIHRFLFFKRVCEIYKNILPKRNLCLSTK